MSSEQTGSGVLFLQRQTTIKRLSIGLMQSKLVLRVPRDALIRTMNRHEIHHIIP